MIEAIFSFNNSVTSIQCNETDKMKDIFAKYVSKIRIDISKVVFLYGGNTINGDLMVNELDNGTNKLNILVCEIDDIDEDKKQEVKLKKSNNIVCSTCKGLCRMEMKGYKIALSECENGHLINDIFINNFNETQYIDESKIICDDCKSKNKNESYNNQFFYCCECKQNLCALCKFNHEKKNHKIIDYEKKNYICDKHIDNYISYCVNCSKNLCFYCETEHDTNHIINSYKNITPSKTELNENMNQFQEKVEIFNETIENIVKIMNELKENIEKYNEIFINIFNNFNLENRNYNVLRNINELMNNNIMQDINDICNNTNIYSQFKILINMYQKMNNNIIPELKNQFENEDINVKYSNLKETRLLLNYGENSVCKLEDEFDNKKILGTGFFVQIGKKFGIPIKKALFTCNHILPEEFFQSNKYLFFNHKGNHKKIDIKESIIFKENLDYIDFRKCYYNRKIFINKELDYTFIEILDSDDYIFEKDYEFFKMDFLNSNDSSDIAFLHYPNGEDLSFSFGSFKKMNDDVLVHNCYSELESDGAPIINKNKSQYIIGIHYGKSKNLGLGHFIDKIFSDIKNNFIKFIHNENSLQNNFKTLDYHKNYITNIIALDNRTLCSCSIDGNLIVFDIFTFECLGIIKGETGIIYHAKLSNNKIILCCQDGTLKIYKEKIKSINPFIREYNLIQTLKGHEKEVCKVVEINENIIISCALDTTMKVWKMKKKENIFVCIDTIEVNEEIGYSTNILKIKENELVSAASNANYIIFWNLNTFSSKKKIDNIVCNWNRNSMKLINRNTLFIGGDEFNGIYLIDIDNYEVTYLLIDNNILSITTIVKLSNNNILIGCKKQETIHEDETLDSYYLIEYEYKDNTLTKVKEKENVHSNLITGLINLNNLEIVSCSLDGDIKFWI